MVRQHGAPQRRSMRLKGYDYGRAGAYSLTICADGQGCIFGEVRDSEMCLNGNGDIVWACWQDLPRHYAHVCTDVFMVMPNHVHGIIVLTDTGSRKTDTRHGLPEIVRALKTFSARRINELRRAPGARVWQRGYFDHVVRNEDDLDRIRRYIVENPARWSDDEYHPSFGGSSR